MELLIRAPRLAAVKAKYGIAVLSAVIALTASVARAATSTSQTSSKSAGTATSGSGGVGAGATGSGASPSHGANGKSTTSDSANGVSSHPHATTEMGVADTESRLCASTAEYIKTLKFLRESKEFAFQEVAARKIADDVSKGCDGAAQRFAQVLLLLRTVGVSESRCLQMALEFSKSPPDVQKNFLEIFTQSFLKEFFDFEYNRALQIALELSKDYKGDPQIEREDFISMSHFCRDPSALSLPVPFCSEYSLRIAKLSQYFKSGVAGPFRALFKDLRDKSNLKLDVKTALELSHHILKSGPRAPDNFIQAVDFAEADFKLDKKAAIKFALDLSAHSYVGDGPPIQQTGISAKSADSLTTDAGGGTGAAATNAAAPREP